MFELLIEFSGNDNLRILGAVLGLDVAVNSFNNLRLLKISITQLAPNFRISYLLSILRSSRNIFNVVDKNFSGINNEIEFVVNDEGFFVELVFT